MANNPRNPKGQGLVEYALILVLVAVVVIVILALLGPAIGNIFSNIINSLNPTATPTPGQLTRIDLAAADRATGKSPAFRLFSIWTAESEFPLARYRLRARRTIILPFGS